MREFAKISPQFWINDTGRELKRLGVDVQLIAFYLLTNPHANMIGIYYLPRAFISHETGIPYERVVIALESLIEIHFCRYDDSTEYIWVCDMASDQIDRLLKPNDNRVKGINDVFHLLPKLPFLDQFFAKYSKAFHLVNRSESEGALKALISKEKKNGEEISKEENEKKKAVNILNFFNEVTGKNYRENDESLTLIINRLNSGVTERQCFQLIANIVRSWNEDEFMRKFLSIETLFGPKFEKYLAELPKEIESPEEKDTEKEIDDE